MFERLAEVEQRYLELSVELSDPALMADRSRYQSAARALSELQDLVDRFREFRSVKKQIGDTETLLAEESDQELVEMAKEELAILEGRSEALSDELRLLLLPKDPNDQKNVVLEIRAGTGGDEATLFAQDIFRMFTRYAENRRWKTEIISSHPSAVGGLKEVIAVIEGRAAFSRLKFESGVHRVQRVPETETQGRVHTSAVTVAVLPEADEVDIAIEAKDLRIDRYCSSGPGGQSVNTTYSAIRITHLPTGEIVTCQDEKSQIKNKAKALKVLRSRLMERAIGEQEQEIAENRRAMVGRGDRSEKIRTYNFPQNRVTDHRIGLTIHRLESILEGDLDPIIDPLITYTQSEALKNQKIA